MPAEEAEGSGRMPCSLKLVPQRWWLQLVHMLPEEDKQALFQVSMPLAIRLLQTPDKVALHIRLNRSQQVQAHTRRHMPFPIALSSQVTSLCRFHDMANSPSTAILDWGAFQSLSELSYITNSDCEPDINRLCSALEARQLPNLQKVCFELTREQEMIAKLPDTIAERLARALGPQLKELSTGVASLLTYLPHFKTLQAVRVHFCDLTAVEAQQLCEQPNLHTVRFGPCMRIEGDHKARSCSWGCVVFLDDRSWKLMPALPLASVPQICIAGSLSCSSDTERQLLQALLAEHGDKFECQPRQVSTFKGLPTFTLHSPCEEMLPLLAKLQVSCRLQLNKDATPTSVMHAIWSALPACVQTVTLDFMHTVDWQHLWQGLPEHVHTLEIWHCDVHVSALCELVRTAPKHILAIELTPWRRQYAELEAAGLNDGKIGHVEVRIRRF